MTHTLTYDGRGYELADEDMERLTRLYKKQSMALGPQLFTFTPPGAAGSVTLAISAGVPLSVFSAATESRG